MEGSDFECPGSLLPGACAFSSPFDAVSICVWLTACRAVTVYANGGSCSPPAAPALRTLHAGPNPQPSPRADPRRCLTPGASLPHALSRD